MEASPRYLEYQPGAGLNSAPRLPSMKVLGENARRFLSRGAGFLLIFLCSCSPRDDADLRIINGKEPESLDPAIVVGQPDGRVVNSLFEGLTRYNATNAAPEPAIAARWEISSDAKVYTFHLRTNALWSTGEPITADDFVFSWFRVLEPETAADYVGNLFYIRGAEAYHLGTTRDRSTVGIRALNEHALLVELANPTPFFLDLCAFPTQAVVHRATVQKHGDRWLNARPLPCSGAYQLESWRLNDRIRVRKNRYYWDAQPGQIDRIDFFPVNSPNTALNLYLKGEVDIVWDKDVTPSELLDLLKDRPDFHTFDYLGSYFFRFNTTRPPFDDVRVRKALALAVDREAIVRFVLRGGQKGLSHFVPPGLPGYTSPSGLSYDPALARQFLREAGYPEGRGFPRVQFHFNSSRDNEKIAVQLQETWRKELGLGIELRAVEWKVWIADQAKLNYDLSKSSWIGDYADPNTFLDMFMSSNPNNRTGWKSDRYDSLLRAANATADLARRSAFLREAEGILISEAVPIVPLYIYRGFNFFDPDRITGIHNEQNKRDEHPVRAIRKRPRS